MKKIAVLASGGGSNMHQLIKHDIALECVITDRPCNATTIASDYGIPTYELQRDKQLCDNISDILKQHDIDLVVLAGYLSIIDKNLTEQFTIINIHPSLLPKYGGKGMYGMHVHKAVLANGDNVSGCTVHYVNEGIDTGNIIAQAEVDISSVKTAEDIQQLVIEQEWKLLPRVVKRLLGTPVGPASSNAAHTDLEAV